VAGSGLALQLYKLFHCEGRFAAELVQPRALAVWQGGFDFQPPLTLAGRAAEDGALKLVFQTADGHRVESVLIAMPGGNGAKATLCLSSQVGCAMGCAFCRTGTMGLIRDLRAEEIVAQAWLARRQLGLSFGNLVFMGMGEPLDNLAGLAQALRVLTDGSGLAFGQERVTVCTCGHVDGLRAFAALGYKRIGLSVSLNAPDDATRSRLMTVNRRWPLAALEAALLAYPRRRNFYFALNYCLIPGVNDSADDFQSLAEFLSHGARLPLSVELLPFNELAKTIREAFFIARTGRQGPVLVDIPVDVQKGIIEFLWPEKVELRSYQPTAKGNPNQIKKAAEAIKKAKKLVLYAGGGINSSNASKELKAFAEKIDAPVGLTLLGLGAFPADHKQFMEMFGMHGSKAANLAMHESDLIICVGARFDDRVTGKLSHFAQNAEIVHIDVDPSSISKTVAVDIPIVGDAKQVLVDLTKAVEPKKKAVTKYRLSMA